MKTVAAAIRRLIGPEIFAEPARRTIVVPIRDDGWSPQLLCGEFAVVETTERNPEDGALVCLWNSTVGTFSIVKLHLWTREQSEAIVKNPGDVGPWWSMVYGAQRVGNWKPCHASWAPNGVIHLNDGPAGDDVLRKQIVGRVIGVLGSPERAINWRQL